MGNRIAQRVGIFTGQGPDSTCAMQMVKQGTGSFKRAKHIKVWYFWLKLLINEGLLELKYTPMEELVADVLTKPLMGWKFKYLLHKYLGWNIEIDSNCDINEEVCCAPYANNHM